MKFFWKDYPLPCYIYKIRNSFVRWKNHVADLFGGEQYLQPSVVEYPESFSSFIFFFFFFISIILRRKKRKSVKGEQEEQVKTGELFRNDAGTVYGDCYIVHFYFRSASYR